MFLLDTNVISELRQPRPHGGGVEWFRTIDSVDFAIPAVAVGEIQIAIERTRRNDPAKASDIEAWLTAQIAVTRIVPMDGETFRIWARIVHMAPVQQVLDAMIVATAIQHGLTLATRNTRDFELFAVSLLNPFDFRA